MNLPIYRAGVVIANIPISESFIFNRALMADHHITVNNLITATGLPVQLDDYILFNGIKYTLNVVPNLSINNLINSSLVFEAPEYSFYDKLVRHQKSAAFPYYGDARKQLELIIANVNEIYPGFTLGVVDPTDEQFVQYEDYSCRVGVTKVAEQFGLEFEFSGPDGMVLNMVKNVGRETNLTFEYGINNGLYNLTRNSINDQNVKTRVFGFGGTRNLPAGYRGGALNLIFADEYKENNVDLYGIKEGQYKNENIYPTREGVISAVGSVTNDSTVFTVSDDSLDFNVNDYLLAIEAKISFTSGELLGEEFTVIKYDHATKTFTLKAKTNSANIKLPQPNFKAELGDKYKLLDISLPQPYVNLAEAQLAQETEDFVLQNSVPQVEIGLNFDIMYLRDNNINLMPGDKVTILNAPNGINSKIRVTAVNFPISFPAVLTKDTKYTATLSNVITYTLQERLIKGVLNNKAQIINVDRRGIETAKRNAFDLRVLETSVFDTDGMFDTDKFNVGVLSAALGIFGVKSQNFILNKVILTDNYLGNPNAVFISNGELIHLEMSNPNNQNVWQMQSVTKNDLTAASFYYIYARCSKNSQVGTFLITTDQIKYDAEANYFNFLAGIIYPVQNGFRDSEFTNGITDINGARIKTGIIQGRTGNLIINLETGEIQGKLTFQSNSGALLPVAGVADTANNAQSTANAAQSSATTANVKIDNLQIGGRNYFGNTITGIDAYQGAILNQRYSDGFRVLGTSANNGILRLFNVIKSNGWYTVSFDAKVYMTDWPYTTLIEINDVVLGIIDLTLQFKHFEFSLNVTNFTPDNYNFIDIEGLSGQDNEFRNFKVEKGNKATAYTPAPEDVEAQALQASNQAKADAIAAAAVYTNAQDIYNSELTKAYADGIVTAEEQARINQAAANLQIAKDDATTKANLAEAAAKAVANAAQQTANNAVTAAQNAANDAAAAAGIANGKGKVLIQNNAPGVNDQNDVTLWIDTTNGGNIPKKWNGGAWVVVTDKTATDAAQAAVNAASAANAAQISANNAQQAADVAKAAADAAQATANQVNANLINLQNALGGMAYENLVGLAKLDTTVIEGGYIKSTLIEVSALIVRGNLETQTGSQNKANAAQAAAQNTAQDLVNNLQIGGRNLWRRYYTNLQIESPGFIFGTFIDGFDLRGGSSNTINLRINPIIDSNGFYTLSFESKSQIGWNQHRVEFNDIEVGFFDSPTEYKKYTFTLNVTNYTAATYNFIDIYGLSGQDYSFRKFKFEKGNKATDWSQAPEDATADATQAAQAAENAAKAYATAQDNVKAVEAAAYADGKVSAEEQRAINDANTKLAEAKADATTKADAAKVAAQNAAFTDAQAKADAAKTAAENAAKAYADAQDALRKTEAAAYADGKVTAEEQARINQAAANLQIAKDDATAKTEAAKIAAQNLVNNIQIGGVNYFSNVATGLELYRSVVNARSSGYLNVTGHPNNDALVRMLGVIKSTGYYTISFEVKSQVGWANNRININQGDQFYYDSTNDWTYHQFTSYIPVYPKYGVGYDFIDFTDLSGQIYEFRNVKIERGNKATAFTIAPEDVKAAAETAAENAKNIANTYTDTKSAQTISAAQIYADASATSKANAAQANAVSQAADTAQAKANAAQAAAEALSQQLVNNIQIGGRNYYKNSSPIGYYQGSYEVQRFSGGFAVGSGGNNGGIMRILDVMPFQGFWTISFEARTNISDWPYTTTIDFGDQTSFLLDLTTSFKKFSFTHNYTGPHTFIDIEGLSGQQTIFRNFKLEVGTKATDYTPAPEDVQTAIDTAQAAANAANTAYNNLTASLKSLAYVDVVELAKLGNTVIQGGKLTNTLIDTEYIKVNVINAGYINSLELVSKSIRTANSGTKRIEITQETNNIRMYDAANNVLIEIDDDSAFERFTIQPNDPPIPPTVTPVYGPGMRVGVVNDPNGNGFSSMGRTGFITDGLFQIFKKNGIYPIIDFNSDYERALINVPFEAKSYAIRNTDGSTTNGWSGYILFYRNSNNQTFFYVNNDPSGGLLGTRCKMTFKNGIIVNIESY